MVAVFVLLPDERDLTKSFCCAALVCVFHGNLSSGAAAAGLVLGLGSSAAVGQSWCVSLILFCRLDLFFSLLPNLSRITGSIWFSAQFCL
jgi:hypothetical protein